MILNCSYSYLSDLSEINFSLSLNIVFKPKDLVETSALFVFLSDLACQALFS